MIDCDTKDNAVHAFSDGSVSEEGLACCGVLMWEYNRCKEKHESTVALRLSDGITSTQAELYGTYVALRNVKDKGKDAHIFVDSRAALDSLNSHIPVYAEIVTSCKSLMNFPS